MAIYVVCSPYFNSGVYGTYSSVKRAREAFEYFLETSKSVISSRRLDDYCYQFTAKNGKTFGVRIYVDVLDAEFVEGFCKEDE